MPYLQQEYKCVVAHLDNSLVIGILSSAYQYLLLPNSIRNRKIFVHFQFCCAPRKQIKAFVTPKDMAEIHQAAKRLNVSSTVQSMVANADPKRVESTFEELKTVDEHLVDISYVIRMT